MLPLVDMHCHLLAGLDDGPQSDEEALEMCRMAFNEGIRMSAATAHQNEDWPEVCPARIGEACQKLTTQLRAANIPLTVQPCAEVMVHPELETHWHAGRLLTIGNAGRYMLIELPHQLFVDLRPIVCFLRELGIRPILAHPERQEELLHDSGVIEDLIGAGCLVQVSTHSITEPRSSRDLQALRAWFRRGIVHVLGTDGHSPRRRPPRMRKAYEQVCRWLEGPAADRICSTNGMAILQGVPLRVPAPVRDSRGWLPRFW